MGFGPPKNVHIVEFSNYGSYNIMCVYREGYTAYSCHRANF